MSFSADVKEELGSVYGNGAHCVKAELFAMRDFAGFPFRSENKTISIKCFTLLKKTFNISVGISVKKWAKTQKALQYQVFAEACGDKILPPTAAEIHKKDCCKRAYLRGAYLTIGSMSDPSKGYHLEFVCTDAEKAERLTQLLAEFGIEAKTVMRKKYYVVYLKEGEAIVDFLGLIGAHGALMEMENARIYKEMRNFINRRVNCEAANITKTVTAANRQVEDILFLKEKIGLSSLPDNLRDMAYVRLEYPEATLAELTKLMDPPVGKSGINHRLRKLSDMADKLRVN